MKRFHQRRAPPPTGTFRVATRYGQPTASQIEKRAFDNSNHSLSGHFQPTSPICPVTHGPKRIYTVSSVKKAPASTHRRNGHGQSGHVKPAPARRSTRRVSGHLVAGTGEPPPAPLTRWFAAAAGVATTVTDRNRATASEACGRRSPYRRRAYLDVPVKLAGNLLYINDFALPNARNSV